MTTESEDILRTVTFYRQAPPELQSRMLAAARPLRLAPGDRLFREGDVATSFAVVRSGSIRVFRIGSTGREITLYHVDREQSSLIGMLSALLETPAAATAQAEIETDVVLLAASGLREWVRTSNEMRAFIFATMTRALVDVTTLLEDVAFRSVESRLASFLVRHATKEGVVLLRHEDIASEMGTAREVVSRLLESYERTGAITLSRGRVAITNEAQLRRAI
jgi:CRP/FNR family transcriptional regulator, anaerobic regulatory protein